MMTAKSASGKPRASGGHCRHSVKMPITLIICAFFAKIPCVTSRLSHNTSVLYCRKWCALWLMVILAGCSTTPPPPRQMPPDVNLLPDHDVVASHPLAVVAPKPATNNFVAQTNIQTNVSVTIPAPPQSQDHLNATDTWVLLERWCQASGYAAPHHIANETAPTWSFGPANETIIIHAGSQVASWHGIEYHLGFAPEVMNGRPYVHALDIRKNFMPLLESSLHPLANHVVVIDPGHGGTDTGTSNVYNHHFEKEFTLDLAFRVQKLLATNGWTVLLTRSNDLYVALSNRVAFAEQHKAGLFLSLHFNSAFPDRQEAGLETYCLTPHGMHSTLTRDYSDNSSLTFPNNRFDFENLQYAAHLHRALLNVNGYVDRGVRRARFLTVLQGQNRPALLMECGYLSNPREARQIADPAHRQKIAEAIATELFAESSNAVNITGNTNSTPQISPMAGEKPAVLTGTNDQVTMKRPVQTSSPVLGNGVPLGDVN